MPSREPLSKAEIDEALSDGLSDWSFSDDKLQKTFEFSNFREAISFIVRLSFVAEEMNHHPELENVYNTVSVALTTHDAGGKVTETDVQLASEIEDFVWI